MPYRKQIIVDMLEEDIQQDVIIEILIVKPYVRCQVGVLLTVLMEEMVAVL